MTELGAPSYPPVFWPKDASGKPQLLGKCPRTSLEFVSESLHIKDFKLFGEFLSAGLNDESFRIVYLGRLSQGSDLFRPDSTSCPVYFRCVGLWIAFLFLQQCSSKHFLSQNSRVISEYVTCRAGCVFLLYFLIIIMRYFCHFDSWWR